MRLGAGAPGRLPQVVGALHLEDDRDRTLEQLRRVINGFGMPATHLLADSAARANAVRSLKIFSEAQFYADVLVPIMNTLGIEKAELRNRAAQKKSLPSAN